MPLEGGFDARVRVPGSKSLTNRALVAAALADGVSHVRGALFSNDTLYMAQALRAVGFEIDVNSEVEEFVVVGRAGKIPTHQAEVFAGNAGTVARFMLPLLAIGNGKFRVDGLDRMRERPMWPQVEVLRELGALITRDNRHGSLPLTLTTKGLAQSGDLTLAGNLSSQFLSGLLLVGPYVDGGLDIGIEGKLVSAPYVAMTESVMSAFGVKVEHPHRESHDVRFRVSDDHGYLAHAFEIEPDASAASYFFAAAAITGGRVVVEGLGTDSIQGDMRFVSLLEKMGAKVRQDSHSTEVTGGSELSGIEVDMADISDTVQTLAVVAACANSPTRITGVDFIRHKETDRLCAVTKELRRLGIEAEETPDGVTIDPTRSTIRKGRVQTYDDHRMAMSFAILGLARPGIEIVNPGCVAKTFPNFFTTLAGLRT